jgi:selT/selW/selH-like putative selenoprotein
VRGSGGIFVVTVDNEKIFSKKEEGRFPTEREILDALRKRAS